MADPEQALPFEEVQLCCEQLSRGELPDQRLRDHARISARRIVDAAFLDTLAPLVPAIRAFTGNAIAQGGDRGPIRAMLDDLQVLAAIYGGSADHQIQYAAVAAAIQEAITALN